MSIINGTIIEAPVDAWEAGKVLGVRSGDIGTVCTSTRINPWAKYKPVNHTKFSTLTDAERASVQYGMTNIPLFANQADMASFVVSDTPAPMTGSAAEYWAYELPPYNRPKRLSDFDGYWHQAIRCIEPLEIDRIDVSGMADNDLICFDFPVATEAANLKISDFAFTHLWREFESQITNNATYYLGVCLTDGTEAGTRTVTQDDMMNNGIPNLIEANGKKYAHIGVTRAAFMAAAPPSGILTVFPFVTDDSKTTFGLPGLENHPAVPFNFAFKNVEVITGNRFVITFGDISAATVTMNKEWEITVKVNIRNQSGTDLFIDSSNRGNLYLYTNGSRVQDIPLFEPNVNIPVGDTPIVRKFTVTTGGDYYAVAQWTDPTGTESYNVKSKTISF